ncbi:MAG: GreA/GreB family elongation factor [Phycisphaerae bacterium]
MQPDSLVKLVATGNVRTVEEEWMQIIESVGDSPCGLAAYDRVLGALRKADKEEQAGALAWAALEGLSAKFEPGEVLPLAGAFLLAVGDHAVLRKQVSDLYRVVYSDAEGLDALIQEAGLEVGRPVRRALRTLDVCLALEVGSFLRARDEVRAARVDAIDKSVWEFDITTSNGSQHHGAVRLADLYEQVTAEDFTVRRFFFPEELQRALDKKPGSVVLEVVAARGGELTRDEVELALVPSVIAPDDWKKWWSRARAGLKKYPNVELERKAPYTITVREAPRTPEAVHLHAFDRMFDPVAQFNAVEAYVRECKKRDGTPSSEVITRCYSKIKADAERCIGLGSDQAGLFAVLARYVGELAGIEGSAEQARRVFGADSGIEHLLSAIRIEQLHSLACQTVTEVRPDSWREDIIRWFPAFPLSACDREAKRLCDAGCGRESFEAIVNQAFADPIRCYEVVLWVWNGPAVEQAVSAKPLITILSRMLRTLAEVGRSDAIDRETAKAIAARTRAMLAARKHERFKACLEEIELSMASALQNQLRRVDALGRAVREDVLRLLRAKFPELSAKPEVVPWEREDVLYVTREGYFKKQKEIDHHVNVKMKENAQAIGAAAERGDLSENSEYKFALEERDLLRARLAQMNAEMAKAKILGGDDVATDHVGIGTKVVFREVGGDGVFEMTIVGSWDSDPEKGWYNYSAPLAQQVLGSKVGETFHFDHGKATGDFEIVRLEDGLIEARVSEESPKESPKDS